MPFTPFHFGPGLALSAGTRSRVSFLSFCTANVLVDCESLYNIVNHHARIHGFFHTYLGATLMAFETMLLFAAFRWGLARRKDGPPSWVRLPDARAVAWGALLGAWSHVLLDSLMHSDITPLAPLTYSNPLFLVMPLRQLHLLCVAAGAIGAALWCLFRFRARK